MITYIDIEGKSKLHIMLEMKTNEKHTRQVIMSNPEANKVVHRVLKESCKEIIKLVKYFSNMFNVRGASN